MLYFFWFCPSLICTVFLDFLRNLFLEFISWTLTTEVTRLVTSRSFQLGNVFNFTRTSNVEKFLFTLPTKDIWEFQGNLISQFSSQKKKKLTPNLKFLAEKIFIWVLIMSNLIKIYWIANNESRLAIGFPSQQISRTLLWRVVSFEL